MNLSVPSYVAGPFFLLILFGLCLFIVVGIKTVFSAIKRPFSNLNKEKTPPAPQPEQKRKRVSKPQTKKATVRSIEIDPDMVDKIYVRKSS